MEWISFGVEFCSVLTSDVPVTMLVLQLEWGWGLGINGDWKENLDPQYVKSTGNGRSRQQVGERQVKVRIVRYKFCRSIWFLIFSDHYFWAIQPTIWQRYCKEIQYFWVVPTVMYIDITGQRASYRKVYLRSQINASLMQLIIALKLWNAAGNAASFFYIYLKGSCLTSFGGSRSRGVTHITYCFMTYANVWKIFQIWSRKNIA